MGTSGKFNIFTALIDPKVGNYVIYEVSLSFSIIYDVQLYTRHTPITMQLQHVCLEAAPNEGQNTKEE